MNKIKMPIILAMLFMAFAKPVNSGGTNDLAKADGEIEQMLADMVRYREGLRNMGLHEYADKINLAGGASHPSVVEQAVAALRFEEFLIANWGKRDKIDEYLQTHGNTHTQLYWLLRLRLAEHHWMRGEKKEAMSIIADMKTFLEDSVSKPLKNQDVQQTPAGDRHAAPPGK